MLELSFRIRNYECNLQSFYQYYCLVLSTQLKLQLLVLYKIYDRNTVYNSSMLSHHSDDITSLSIYTVEIEDDTQTVSWYSQASLHCISVSSYACVCVCVCVCVFVCVNSVKLNSINCFIFFSVLQYLSWTQKELFVCSLTISFMVKRLGQLEVWFQSYLTLIISYALLYILHTRNYIL